jgi:3-dehydroquinate dehydratase/shikimate dehydrogenase
MVDGNQDVEQLIGLISQKKPDLVEFRLDNLNNFTLLEHIARKKSFPAIASDRSERDVALTKKMLMTAASSGFEYVDIDLHSTITESDIRRFKSAGSELIRSFHDFSKTPCSGKLDQVLDSQIKAGGDICKVVTTAVTLGDNLSILRFVEEKSPVTRLVSFAMGWYGVPSRILSPLFGSEFTFASLSEDSRTAEGQLTVDKLRSVWQILGVQ